MKRVWAKSATAQLLGVWSDTCKRTQLLVNRKTTNFTVNVTSLNAFSARDRTRLPVASKPLRWALISGDTLLRLVRLLQTVAKQSWNFSVRAITASDKAFADATTA